MQEMIPCNNCGELKPRRNMENHLLHDCGTTQCHHCDQTVVRAKLSLHVLKDCEMKMVLCERGCGARTFLQG